MKTCFFRRSHAREHYGIQRDCEMLYTMKSYDEAPGLVYLLDGNWGVSVDHSSELGCRFGYNSFLDYGAEFMCSEFSPIREIWALSGLTERKSADADWKWGFHQQQASLHNSSTLLGSTDRFDGTMAMTLKNDVTENDVTAASESSILCAASKTQLCSHARRNRPKRLHMIPPVDSNAALLVAQKESSSCFIAKGHACLGSLPVRTFPIQNDSCAVTCRDVDSSLISSCAPSCVDKLCLASLLCDEKMIPVEKNFLDVLPTSTGLTDLIPPKSHLRAVTPSLFKSVMSITNQSIDEKRDLKVSDEGGFNVTDQEIETLGKALCHAQTRARLAEKLAKQTSQEINKLRQLLIREAWTTYTYRQRALSLELENRLLKLCPKLELGLWENRENAHICKPVEARSGTSSKLSKKQHPSQECRKESHLLRSSHGKKSKPRGGVPLSCAVGFAFLVGLSIAGTGIAIVWSVGWVFFSDKAGVSEDV